MKKHFFSLCLAAHATFQPMVVAQQSVDNTSDSDANSTVRNEVIDGGAINQNINSVRNEDDFEVKTKFGACSGQSNFLLKLNADQVLGTFDTTILGVAMEFNLGKAVPLSAIARA